MTHRHDTFWHSQEHAALRSAVMEEDYNFLLWQIGKLFLNFSLVQPSLHPGILDHVIANKVKSELAPQECQEDTCPDAVDIKEQNWHRQKDDINAISQPGASPLHTQGNRKIFPQLLFPKPA